MRVFGVATTASNNVWAVGDTTSPIQHWNGTSWKAVAAPVPNFTQLSGAAATSASNAWAVGYYPDSTSVNHEVILHWNGRNWSRAV